jgi:multiple sugar transport system permease protein
MKKRSRGKILAYSLLAFCSLSALFPIYWTVLTSFRTRLEIFQQPPLLWGGNITFDNYQRVMSDDRFLSALINTIVVSVLATFICVFVGALAAYGIARSNRFIGKGPFEAWMIIIRALPGIVLAVPLYQLVVQFGLYDNLIVLAVCYAAINLPFSVWLMVGFISGIPYELEESAKIDGASQFAVMVKILLPLTKSGIAATTIFVMMLCWNEFLLPLVLADQSARTLPVYVAGFVTSRTIDYGSMAAAASLSIIPIAIVTLIVQRQLVRGMSLGAVKD